ncbi:putative carboxypeptidase D [Helianthus anomalus]
MVKLEISDGVENVYTQNFYKTRGRKRIHPKFLYENHIYYTTERKKCGEIICSMMQVGNALTDYKYDNIGTVEYWWTHALISDATYKTIMSCCNFSTQKQTRKCDKALLYAWSYEMGGIDEYSIYTPKCNNPSTSSRLKNSLVRRRVSGYDPCVEMRAEKYYNRPDVQHAMHANYTRIPYKFTACR